MFALQGSSSERYVASRLIPMRRDSPEEQEAQMPLLALLTEEQRGALAAKQSPTEEPSLLQWTRSVGVEPPPPPDNVTEALEGRPRPPARCLISVPTGGDVAWSRRNGLGESQLDRACRVETCAEPGREAQADSQQRAGSGEVDV